VCMCSNVIIYLFGRVSMCLCYVLVWHMENTHTQVRISILIYIHTRMNRAKTMISDVRLSMRRPFARL
jgi:hypothetical protein